MLSPHFQPVEIDGIKFDKGMILYEFDALREPERARFRQIGAWIKEPMNQIPTPEMWWQGRYWPDLYIANQLHAAVGDPPDHAQMTDKRAWPDSFSLQDASLYYHGKGFHDTFIEPMCRKITGGGTADIAAKYHRAVWLPLYWPRTLRARQSIPTPFWYPRAGHAGIWSASTSLSGVRNVSTGDITITFLLAKPRHEFSVLFVVDDSPIYRITDMDVCAGIETEWHRWVVESRGPWVDPPWAYDAAVKGAMNINLPKPIIGSGYKPKPTLNDQLWGALCTKS